MNAYIDKLLTEDEMHAWLASNTDKIKAQIRSGELQKIYEKMFEEEN